MFKSLTSNDTTFSKSTKWLPITLNTLSSTKMSTELIPALWMLEAIVLLIFSPCSTIISPVEGFIISAAAIWLINLRLIANFLLNLYLPTLDKSYLLASKNKESINETALSTVGGSPGLNLL